MAWRIHDQVIRGELDCRAKGKVTGTLWLKGRLDPIVLDLEGSSWSDMAGCLLKFENPHPVEGNLDGLVSKQCGVCGDLTASRKVKIPTVPLREWLEKNQGESIPFRWAAGIYLEWFGEVNGRVLIESADYHVTISEPAWRMTEEEEAVQRWRGVKAMSEWMTRVQESAGRSSESSDSTEGNDPEITTMVESVLRVQDLKQEVERVSGVEMISGSNGTLPARVEERFWESVLAIETAPRVRRAEILAKAGIHPPHPSALADDELNHALWELIVGLAGCRQFLENTDHLSDRELYTLLVERVLQQETEMLPPELGWNCHISIHEFGVSGDENGERLYLRYYADSAARERWAADFPDYDLPPHEDRRYDRDRHLPRAETIEP